MKFSIITVAYNSAATIQDTFNSILSQTYPNIEYIVIDGGSNDGTVELIKENEPRFNGKMKWKSEKDNGLYDAMNKGISMASGDIVGILNSDDIFAIDNALELVVNCFSDNPLADCVFADLYYVAKNDTSKIIRYWKTGESKPFSKGWHPAHPTFYVKNKFYKSHSLFDLRFRLAADFELMLRYVEKEKISKVYFPYPLVKMRLGGETSKNIRNVYKQNLECIRAFRLNNIPFNLFLYPLYRLTPKLLQYKKK